MAILHAVQRGRTTIDGSDPEADYPVPDEDRFKDADEHELHFIPADDLERLAALLKVRYANKFVHWLPFTVKFLWKQKGGKRAGQTIFGKCNKPGGLTRHYADADFVIWLAADHCRTYALDRFQVEALLFHEMLHVGVDDETGAPKPRGHDRELFCEEIEEYGLWDESLQDVARAVQGRLDDLVEGGQVFGGAVRG